jgi:SPOR domain
MARKRRERSRNVARSLFAGLWVLLGGVSSFYLWGVFGDPAALGKQTARFNPYGSESPTGSTAVYSPSARENDSAELAEIKAALRDLSQQMADMNIRVAALHAAAGSQPPAVAAAKPPAPPPASAPAPPPAPAQAMVAPPAPAPSSPPPPVTVSPPLAPVTVSPPEITPEADQAAAPAEPAKPAQPPAAAAAAPETPKPVQQAADQPAPAPKPVEPPKPGQEAKPGWAPPVTEADLADGPPEPNPVAAAPLDEPADAADAAPEPGPAAATTANTPTPAATPGPEAPSPADTPPPEADETETARLDPVTLPPAANDGSTRYGIELGAVAKQDALRPLWREFLNNHAALVAGLQPRRVLAPDKQWRLIAGPFSNATEAEAACALFKKASKPCEPTVFAGDGL